MKKKINLKDLKNALKNDDNNIFISSFLEDMRNEKNKRVAIGDNFAIRNKTMTAGSNSMNNFIPPYSATIIDLLKQNNIDIIGKTNMDEFQVQSYLEKPIYGQNGLLFEDINVKNASYSSSLSVFKGYSDNSIVSDMDGDSRVPSSYLHLFGYKPSYGLVSRYGLTQCFNTFEQPSIISKNVDDIIELLEVLVKKDLKDLNTVDYKIDTNKDLDEIKIGIPNEVFELIKSEEIKDTFDDIINLLEDNNILVEKFDSNFLDESFKAYTILSNTELSSNMMKYTGLIFGNRVNEYKDIFDMYSKSRRESFGMDLISRIILGVNYVTGEKNDDIYKVAFKNRVIIKSKFYELFNKFDFLLIPTTPYTLKESNEDLSLEKILYNKIFTSLSNLCESPAISIPIIKEENKPSIGFQILANRLDDNNLLKVGKRIEEII